MITYLESKTVHKVTTKKLIGDYIKEGVEGLKISKNHGGRKPRITDESREIILSVLFNDSRIFGYLRNKWSLSSIARCLTDALDIPDQFQTPAAYNQKLRSQV